MITVLSWVWPDGPNALVYMLQQFEYNPVKYAAWIATSPNLRTARKRGKLVPTRRAQLMRLIAYATYLAWLAVSVAAALYVSPWLLLLLLLAQPAVAFVLLGLSAILQACIVTPRQQKEIAAAAKKLNEYTGLKIAVLGSYGKTSMKELLLTVLSEGKNVAATPGNKNVLISHARWINSALTGNEDVLIFEYGEAEPGDIAKFAEFSKPDKAVITGIAPAHLDYYPTLESVADDFASIADFVAADDVLCNASSELLTDRLPQVLTYEAAGADGWRVSDIRLGLDGTRFTLSKGKHQLKLHTGLLGEHQVGPVVAAVVLAKQLGLSDEQISAGVAATKPYEHRMEPRQLYGAWVVDDAYNGNIEGMRAGLALLKALPAKRRIYVTPGLVDQGVETKPVHIKLGRMIAETAPDHVVLMKNSVSSYIQQGLTDAGYSGEVTLETDPLAYYTSLDQHVASGDVVLLQNDWPDSYA